DEVMTGFRVSTGGAQQAYGIDPDITCLGKVIGGGLPVGAYAGKRHIMETVAPVGNMYQAGTLSGNPLAMTAGLTTIGALLEDGVFGTIADSTALLADGMAAIAEKHGIPIQTGHAGTMFGFYFLREDGAEITDFATAKQYAHVERYAAFFHAMLAQGVYFAPSQYEAGFVSAYHTPEIINATLDCAEEVLADL
ncbi:MAG: aminotransferase class III-fold pyridoxal phosphate-dependent enzyme, partial [Chloroflexota bacterium]